MATALDGAADLRDFTYPQKTLLIMGSEAEGVSHSLLEKSAARVKIPMLGEAESLNVGVAAGILLYEAWCSRIRDGTDFLLSQMIDVPRP